MFEKFLSTNAGDFRQRYQGTYGFFSRSGKKQLVRLANVDTEMGVIKFVNSTETPFNIRWDAEEDVGFEFISPKPCWHNTKMGPLMVRRIAQRQYQRGISDTNTAISNPGGGHHGIHFEVLSAIFENPLTIKEAAKSGIFALSDQMLVGEKHLWLFNQAIGNVTRDGAAIKVVLNDPAMFITEVNDAFRRAEIGVTVS